MKVKLCNGWGGTEFTTEHGSKVDISVNFRAACCHTGRQVLVISHIEKVKDMGASWDNRVFVIYDEENLTILSNTINIGQPCERPRYIEFKAEK